MLSILIDTYHRIILSEEEEEVKTQVTGMRSSHGGVLEIVKCYSNRIRNTRIIIIPMVMTMTTTTIEARII
jgi:hypothetical protein